MASKINLESCDGVVVKVDSRVAKYCGIISTMLEDGLIDIDEEDEAIPLPNVSAPILLKVLDWIEHHIDDQVPSEFEFSVANAGSTELSWWDREYMDVDQQTLIEIMLAANYLDVKGLVALCCKSMANIIRGKSVEEVRETFGLENDFALVEEEWNHNFNLVWEERK